MPLNEHPSFFFLSTDQSGISIYSFEEKNGPFVCCEVQVCQRTIQLKDMGCKRFPTLDLGQRATGFLWKEWDCAWVLSLENFLTVCDLFWVGKEGCCLLYLPSHAPQHPKHMQGWEKLPHMYSFFAARMKGPWWQTQCWSLSFLARTVQRCSWRASTMLCWEGWGHQRGPWALTWHLTGFQVGVTASDCVDLNEVFLSALFLCIIPRCGGCVN